jgi:hypothetical protein
MYNVPKRYKRIVLFVFPQCTYIPRVLQCSSTRRNWDTPHPLPRQQVSLPLNQRGVGQTRLGVRGWGSPNSDDWRKSLALCLLCALLLQKLGSVFSLSTRLDIFLKNFSSGHECRFADPGLPSSDIYSYPSQISWLGLTFKGTVQPI